MYKKITMVDIFFITWKICSVPNIITYLTSEIVMPNEYTINIIDSNKCLMNIQ